MKEKIYQGVSNLFHPMFSMMWATIILINFTPLILMKTLAKWQLMGEVTLYTCILPVAVIYILFKKKKVQDIALHNRRDRIIPLASQLVLLIVLTFLLIWQGLPFWVLRFFYGGIILSAIAFVVSAWWKISGHAMGNAAVTTASFMLYYRYPYIMPFIIPIGMMVITGFVASVRLYFDRHTLAQVAAGALAGTCCMLLFI